jgi:MerR family transcriptional regulator, heat shock protein HspR
MSSPYEMSDDTPVYVISVAAQLSGMHPQTLRTYDRMGLVSPGRSAGRGRRYSLRDVLLLREVQRLSQERVNLEGIRRILELESELQRLSGILTEMTTEMAQLRNELESTRAVAARLAGLLRSRGASTSLVPVRGREAASGRADAASAAEPASDEPGPALPAAGSNAAVPGPGPAAPGPEPAIPGPEPAAARPDPALSPEAE